MIHLSSGDLTKDCCGLSWLVRLRWFAALGQSATCAVAAMVFGVALHIWPLAACIFLTLLSNFLLARRHFSMHKLPPDAVIFGVLLLDTLLLTVMLFVTGGAHNPFSTFYLLQIAIAAILLGDVRVWIIVAATAIGFALLFLSPFELACHATGLFEITFDLHLQGMLLAQVLCGGFLAYFVSSLRRNLRKIDAELAMQRALAESQRHLTSIATLAAGVAHELATPLSTIALASEELIASLALSDNAAAHAEDARLIHQEVQRCQEILSRLNLDALKATNAANEKHDEKPVAVRDLPEAILSRVSAESRDRIVFMGFDSSHIVHCSVDLLVQSVLALVNNSFAAGGDTVVVQCQIGAANLTFSVNDTGVGMEPEVVARAGEPFFSLRPPGAGLGLGLFLTRMFAYSVGGRLHLDSRPGEGTVARLILPLPPKNEPAPSHS